MGYAHGPRIKPRRHPVTSAVLWLGAMLVAVAAHGTDPLRIRRISPSGDAVQPGQELVIAFDRAMTPLGDMTVPSSHVPVRIRPDPGCIWRWLDTTELACRLPGQRHFRPATHYTVRIGTELKALDGAQLPAAVHSDFSTWRPQVEWARLRHWVSPQRPSYVLRFNLPVPARAVAASIRFQAATGTTTAVRVAPYTDHRSGPLWLPVPGLPGAVLEVANPAPDTPLDTDKRRGQARRVWQIVPATDLQADSDYTLVAAAGLKSPLGERTGQGGRVSGGRLHTYGAFAFRGISCQVDGQHKRIRIAPGHKSTAACMPDSIHLVFTAPVPRDTLAASRWRPAPPPPTVLGERWANYPAWFLRAPATPDDTGDSYPLTFKLDATTQYALTLPASVKDRFGRRLQHPGTVHFRTGHQRPFVDLPPLPAVLEADEPTIAPLRFTNLDTFRFRYRRLSAAALQPGAAPSTHAHRIDLLARAGAKVKPDHIVRTSLGLRDMLGHHAGVAWGHMQWTAGAAKRDVGAMLQVTPYQVFAKLGHFNSLVWVNSFKTGTPIAHARVRLLAGPGDTLEPLHTAAGQTVTTDAQGLAILPGTDALDRDWVQPWRNHAKRFYVSVTHGADMALLPLNGAFERSLGEASHGRLWSSRQPRFGHMRTWAISSQGIYRPGSDVRLAVFVRNQNNASLVIPPQLDYTLKITDPGGHVVLEKKHLRLSPFGGIDSQLHIGANAATGEYAISLSWPAGAERIEQQAGHFLVTEFVPAPFKVQATINGQRFGPGDTMHADASARLHAGGPYTGAPLRFSTVLRRQPFAPDTPLASGFTFGGLDTQAPSTLTLARSDTSLDATGHARTQLHLPNDTPIEYGQLQLEAAVQSARGSRVAARADAVYAARDRFIGLRTAHWLQTAGTPFSVQYLVVATDGTPRAGRPLTLTLQRREITRVRVKNGAGDFDIEQHHRWIAEDHCQATSAAVPARCALTPRHAGSYRVLATVTDSRGRVQTTVLRTWVSGPGQVVWPQGKSVTLIADKPAYHVGDVAHIMVQNPFPGARALVTVERYGVLWKKLQVLHGGAPVIDIPVEQAMFPGAYLAVTIFSPRASAPADPDLGKPEVAMGYLPLQVRGHGSALHVQVRPDAAEHKPRQSVAVKVRVRSGDGRAPGHTRLVAAVIDQAVLDLLPKGAASYDPLARFYAPPDAPDIGNYSLAQQLISLLQARSGKGESPGGGGGGGPAVRSQFKSAIYWNASLQTAADGSAAFRFKLPDNLTRWRILVVAMSPGAAMGMGEASVRVNLPLQIEPALPSQVRVGDRFEATFNVTNRTDAQRDVDTTLTVRGDLADGPHQQHAQLKLGRFGHALSGLQVTARQRGEIHFTATARSGSLSDARQAQVPVRLAGAREVAATYGSLVDAAVHIPVALPDGAQANSTGLQVELSPSLIGGLAGAFARLRDDPLQTWEVRLSRSVLAADYLRLAPWLGDTLHWPGARHEIDAVRQRAADFQAPSGGMAFWIPRNAFVSPYLSVYTALSFHWLRAAGYAPPAAFMQRLHGYLRQHILGADNTHAPPSAGTATLRAGAMAALAADGQLPAGAVAGMLPQLHTLDLFGQALLLDAALDTHDTASARHIAATLLSHTETSAGSLSFNEQRGDAYSELLSTPLRANCAILDALVRYKRVVGDNGLLGDTPQKLMRWVGQQRRHAGGWPNSQENVFCTTAIAHYAAVYEPPLQHLAGHLAGDGKPLGTVRFDSRQAPGKQLRVPLDGRKPGQRFRLDLQHAGHGRLYYNVRLSYVMPAMALGATDAGFSVQRHYFVQRGEHWLPLAATTKLARGDIVRVELTVDTPTERHYVVVDDPLPGAFEAVNRQLATAMRSTPAAQPGVAVLMFDGGAWPNMSIVEGGFYHRQTALDAVRFYADDLPAGRYRLVYSAQVVSRGRFIAPAASVREIYQPDVFGRGRARHVMVTAAASP